MRACGCLETFTVFRDHWTQRRMVHGALALGGHPLPKTLVHNVLLQALQEDQGKLWSV